jgi:hypothetical protein
VAQGLGTVGPGPAEPLADGPFGHAQGFGDRPDSIGTFLEQLPSTQQPPLPPVGRLLAT